MEERQGYDVLRIVVHSDRCYMSTDYVKGKQLIVWLKYHSRIDKEMLLGWIWELMENLEHFHQCRGNPCYQYVNPYSIIVGENQKLYLLDLGSREQDEMLHLMQRRYVRENFLSPDNQYYQKASVQEDIYGFGKTVQYLLSAAEVEPALGKMEEFRLKNMISRCVNRNSKKCYQTVREISDHFPNSRKRSNHRMTPLRKVLVCAVILTGFAAAVTQAAGGDSWKQDEQKEGKVQEGLTDTKDDSSQILEDYREEMRQKQEQWDIEKQEIEKAHAERERKLTYELALLYFLELEDYQKCREIIESVEKPEAFAEDFVKLCTFMDDREPLFTEQETEQFLERLKTEIPDLEDVRYNYCVSKGYEKLKEKTQTQGEALQEDGAPDTEVQDGAENLAHVSEGVQEAVGQ